MFTDFENEYSSLRIVDGILHFVYKPIYHLDVRIARKIVGERLTFQRGLHFPILCDTRGIGSSDKAARDFLAKEGSTHAKAVAILDDRNIAQVMHRYYILKNKPIVATKVFSERTSALAFLASFV